MSVCTTTGLSKEQQERWSHLYRHLVEDIEIPDVSSTDESQIQALDAELSSLIKRLAMQKQRVGNHLLSTSRASYSADSEKMLSSKRLAQV